MASDFPTNLTEEHFNIFDGIGEAGEILMLPTNQEPNNFEQKSEEISFFTKSVLEPNPPSNKTRRKRRKLGYKIYFQIQTNNRLRVYEVVTTETGRKQNSLETLSPGEPISSDLLEKLSQEDLERLHCHLNLIRQHERYENVRIGLTRMPEFLDNAIELLTTGGLPISMERLPTLVFKMKTFIDKVSENKTAV